MMIGQRLKAIWNKAGDSQERLAEQLHVAPTTVCSWEQGCSVPDCQKLVTICRYYQVPADYLLGLSEVDSCYEQKMDLGELTEEELSRLMEYKQFLLYRRRCKSRLF